MGQIISDIVAQASCCGGSHIDSMTEGHCEDLSNYPSGTIAVTLDKSVNPKLGLDVENVKTGEVLPVKNVTGGLAEMWNQKHPNQKIVSGAQIVEVNRAKGSVEELMKRCKTDKVLKLIILPPPGSTAASSGAAGSSGGPAQNPSPNAQPKAEARPEESNPPNGGADEENDMEAGVAHMVALGINEQKAREALQMTGGNVDMAIGIASGVNPEYVQNLVGMGFTEEQSLAALERSGGDLDGAMQSLMGGNQDGGADVGAAAAPTGGGGDSGAGAGAGGGGGGGVDQTALAQITAMGFAENQAREALLSSNGDVDQALAICVSAAAEEGPGAGGGGGRGPAAGGAAGGGGGGHGSYSQNDVRTLVDMGFTEQQARDALDGASGNVERAAAILLG